MRCMVAVVLAFLCLPFTSHAQERYYYFYDSTPGSQFSVDLDFVGVNDTFKVTPSALTALLAYEVKSNHMPWVVTPDNEGIYRVLDVSNLRLASGVLDYPEYPVIDRPVTMSDLSYLGGFDHFNFVQTITKAPGNTELVLQTLATGGAYVPLPTPAYDPVVNSQENTMYLHYLPTNQYLPVVVPGVTDGNVGLWNDSGNSRNPLYVGNYTTSSSIYMIDYPKFGNSLFSSSEDFVGFNTSLAGVNADGTINTVWSGIGTQMDWKYFSRYDDNADVRGVYAFNPFNEGPQHLSGKIYGVTIDVATVPEPHGMVMMSIGVAALLALVVVKKKH